MARAPRSTWVAEKAVDDELPGRRPAAPGRPAARRQEAYDEALKQLAGAARRRSSRRWWPTAAATSARAGQAATRPRPSTQGLEGAGRRGRLPPPGRGQARTPLGVDAASRAPRRPRRAAGGAAMRRCTRTAGFAPHRRWRSLAGARVLPSRWPPARAAPTSRSRAELQPNAAADRRAPGLDSARRRGRAFRSSSPSTCSGDSVTVAGGDGTWSRSMPRTGRELWRASAGAPLAAGVGSDGRSPPSSRATTSWSSLEAGGEVLAPAARRRAVVTAPLVAGERVFVLARRPLGARLRRPDGRRLWTQQRPASRWCCARPGVDAAGRRHAGGRARRPRLVGARSRPTAASRWEVADRHAARHQRRRAPGRPGRAASAASATCVCARAFQAAVGCVDADARHAAVDRAASAAPKGVGGDDALVFGTEQRRQSPPGAAPTASAPGPPTGCCYRDLTRRWPSAARSSFGDAQGWCTCSRAKTAARSTASATDGSRRSSRAPVLAGNTLVVVTPASGGVLRLHARRNDAATVADEPTMKPVIALVGRPNVGKSTLFNRLTKTRDAIVADFAGLTRDRHYGNGRQGKHEFIVIDTGGFEPDGRQRHLQGDGQADAPGGGRGRRRWSSWSTRAPACRRRTTTSRDYLRRLGKPTRAGGQQGRGHERRRRSWSSSTSSAWARCTPSRRRTGRASAAWSSWRSSRCTCPRTRTTAKTQRRRAADQAGRGRPAQRRQVDADQHLAGRGAAGGLRPAGHHARRDLACRSSATARSSS